MVSSAPSPNRHRGRRNKNNILRFSSLIVLILVLIWSYAYPRDLDGRYAQSHLKSWFDALTDQKGVSCCSNADGTVLTDADWESKDGHYRVKVPWRDSKSSETVWIVVPDAAVITGPNKDGRTIVWPLYGYLGTTIRCFIPGSMS